MKLAVANQLSIQDLSVTPGPAQYNGGGGDIPNNNSGACDDVQSAIVTLTNIVTTCVAQGNLTSLPTETSYIAGPGEEKCRRDIGIFVDSLALDLFCKGNVTHIDLQQSSLLMLQLQSSHSTQVYTTPTLIKLLR